MPCSGRHLPRRGPGVAPGITPNRCRLCIRGGVACLVTQRGICGPTPARGSPPEFSPRTKQTAPATFSPNPAGHRRPTPMSRAGRGSGSRDPYGRASRLVGYHALAVPGERPRTGAHRLVIICVLIPRWSRSRRSTPAGNGRRAVGPSEVLETPHGLGAGSWVVAAGTDSTPGRCLAATMVRGPRSDGDPDRGGRGAGRDHPGVPGSARPPGNRRTRPARLGP